MHCVSQISKLPLIYMYSREIKLASDQTFGDVPVLLLVTHLSTQTVCKD